MAGMKEVPAGGVCFKSEGCVVLKEDNVSLRDICFQYKASMCVTRPTAYLLRHQIHVSFRYTTELHPLRDAFQIVCIPVWTVIVHVSTTV